MPTHLECLGLGTRDDAALDDLVGRALADATPLGTRGGGTVYRWQDPSGARLTLGVRDGAVVEVLPSFAGDFGALFSSMRPLNRSVAAVSVHDPLGEQVTGMTVEIEQRRLLAAAPPDLTVAAAVTALGVNVTTFADQAAFDASQVGLRTALRGPGEAPPVEATADEEVQPVLGAESFISFGMFAEPDQADAYAWLAGTVLSADRREVAATGQAFVAARVRTAGFEADVCLAGDAAVPEPGAILAGTVFLAASLDLPLPPSGGTPPSPATQPRPPRPALGPARRRWRGRRR